VRLSAFWNNLSEDEKDEITSMDSEAEKTDMFRRIKAHKGRVCFSALDPLQTAQDKRFFGAAYP
jgi:transcription termination factor Rho